MNWYICLPPAWIVKYCSFQLLTLLREISEEAEINFIKEMYEPTIPSTEYNYNVKEAIKEVLNNEFKNKNRLMTNHHYSGDIFVKSIEKNDFPFVFYNRNRTQQTENRYYIIDTHNFVKYINNKIDEHVEIETILESLDLNETLQQRASENNKKYSEYITGQINFTFKNKRKNVRGFYLTSDELISKLFSMDLNLTD